MQNANSVLMIPKLVQNAPIPKIEISISLAAASKDSTTIMVPHKTVNNALHYANLGK